MNLTKRYRVIYTGNTIIIDPYIEYEENSITYVGNGREASEFETLEDTKKFVSDKGLVFDGIE